jgi:phosphomethylpyrimidine synthase
MAALASFACPTGVPLLVGDGKPVRVMALVGTTSQADERKEPSKVEQLAQQPSPPDVIADLSLRHTGYPLWRRVLEAGLPAATLPVYTVRGRGGLIDRSALLERSIEHLEGGVGMVTIHPTPRRDIIELARRRQVPWTSRGGGLVIADLVVSQRPQNVYLDILPDLVPIARAHGATISIGATFRSATVLDADDAAQREEIRFQTELASELRAKGCSVILEGPGHAAPAAIKRLAARMRQADCPIMPLGPIPTDLAIGQDHVSAAIGATLMGLAGAAHILAAVTREEHTGGVPELASTLEAVEAAQVAARVIDLHRLGPTLEDRKIAAARAEFRTCVAARKVPGCSRCGDACPL